MATCLHCSGALASFHVPVICTRDRGREEVTLTFYGCEGCGGYFISAKEAPSCSALTTLGGKNITITKEKPYRTD